MAAYWLRPENALWMALRSWALDQVELKGPCADISCGDGVFTFLHCGGEFDFAFDVFGSAGHLDRVRHEHADMFDCEAAHYAPRIQAPARRQIEVGTDLKENLLHKAAALGIYKTLTLHDNNKRLPLPDASLRTIYCNSAYWVANIDGFLSDLRRVLRPDGKLVVHVKLAAMRDYTLERHAAKLGRPFLELIGRGRLDCWPTLADRQTWEARFARAGLTIHNATPFVTRTHAHIWDIGLRPFAPMLVKMANGLESEERTAIKRDWVDTCIELLTPFFAPDIELFTGANEPAEIQYVLLGRP
jgi:SAM-dependent methyltransferase